MTPLRTQCLPTRPSNLGIDGVHKVLAVTIAPLSCWFANLKAGQDATDSKKCSVNKTEGILGSDADTMLEKVSLFDVGPLCGVERGGFKAK